MVPNDKDAQRAADLEAAAAEQELLREVDQAMEVCTPVKYKIENEGDLYTMAMLDSKCCGSWRITRVPGGWIFENIHRHGYPCFVPYAEFTYTVGYDAWGLPVTVDGPTC